jgi:hypothetical protein
VATGPNRKVRKRKTTAEQAIKLRSRAEQIELEREQLYAEWPEDVTQPNIPTVAAPDWMKLPPIPAERIDWQGMGEPLRVRPTLGGFIAVAALGCSIIGAGAYFYHGVNSHVDNALIHVPKDGVPWGVSTQFETRAEAKAARKDLKKSIDKIDDNVKASNKELKADLIMLLKPQRRGRR